MSEQERYRLAAKRIYHDPGDIEVDDEALVSISPENGAYVQAWVWVDKESRADD